MASVTDANAQHRRSALGIEVAVNAAYALGALALAGEAAVHLQQYVSQFHEVRWLGPLFLTNAAVCAVIVVALAVPSTRVLGALGGIVTSAIALASLVVSYGRGLFGFHEGGFRAAIGWAVVFETGAVILLASALAGVALAQQMRWRPRRMPIADTRPDDSTSVMALHLRAKEKSA